jgi:hypothetical protein|tara:strand:- start:126 stop:371 length:246 start_codon:yes stop_codon:yes gene_type:complete
MLHFSLEMASRRLAEISVFRCSGHAFGIESSGIELPISEKSILPDGLARPAKYLRSLPGQGKTCLLTGISTTPAAGFQKAV